MGVEATAQDPVGGTATPPLDRQRLVPALRREGMVFRLALAGAVLVHSLLIVGITRSAPRVMGERDGNPDGISVELVDAADLESLNSVNLPSSPPPGAPPVPPQPKQAEAREQPPTPPREEPQPPREQPEPQRQVEAKPAPKTEPQMETETRAEPQPQVEQPAPEPERPAVRPAPPQKTAALPPPKVAVPPLPSLSELQREPPPPQPKAKAAPQKQPDQPLQLALPSLPPGLPGRAAAVARPPGITRSGENDEFGRGVIRALRQTMPPPRGQLGRVTIRLLLNDKGNIQEVQLINSGGDPILDQSVVFAARQSSFPLPPLASTVADRTFLVTYVYR